jgi:hypothetical protein
MLTLDLLNWNCNRFRNGLDLVANRLRYLAELSNVDKHRHLRLVKTRLAHHEEIHDPAGNWYTDIRRVDDGTELDPIPTHSVDGEETVSVKRSVSADVSLDELEIEWARTIPIEEILQICIDVVEEKVIPVFEQWF